jgi:phosphate transport system protein
MTSEHTVKAFDTDLRELTQLLAEMGGLVERQVTDVIDALVKRHAELARRVITSDVSVDALQREIEDKSVITLARRQPMAGDLRDIIAILRAANDLERIGDLAKNIAKRTVVLDNPFAASKTIHGISRMAALVLARLALALDSFSQRDVVRALEVWQQDEEIDAYCASLFQELLTGLFKDPATATSGVHLLFCAKNIERMGDHATNIAEAVHYMVEGRALTMERPKREITNSLMMPAYIA